MKAFFSTRRSENCPVERKRTCKTRIRPVPSFLVCAITSSSIVPGADALLRDGQALGEVDPIQQTEQQQTTFRLSTFESRQQTEIKTQQQKEIEIHKHTENENEQKEDPSQQKANPFLENQDREFHINKRINSDNPRDAISYTQLDEKSPMQRDGNADMERNKNIGMEHGESTNMDGQKGTDMERKKKPKQSKRPKTPEKSNHQKIDCCGEDSKPNQKSISCCTGNDKPLSKADQRGNDKIDNDEGNSEVDSDDADKNKQSRSVGTQSHHRHQQGLHRENGEHQKKDEPTVKGFKLPDWWEFRQVGICILIGWLTAICTCVLIWNCRFPSRKSSSVPTEECTWEKCKRRWSLIFFGIGTVFAGVEGVCLWSVYSDVTKKHRTEHNTEIETYAKRVSKYVYDHDFDGHECDCGRKTICMMMGINTGLFVLVWVFIVVMSEQSPGGNVLLVVYLLLIVVQVIVNTYGKCCAWPKPPTQDAIDEFKHKAAKGPYGVRFRASDYPGLFPEYSMKAIEKDKKQTKSVSPTGDELNKEKTDPYLTQKFDKNGNEIPKFKERMDKQMSKNGNGSLRRPIKQELNDG